MSAPSCECGCGGETSGREGVRFIVGHNQREPGRNEEIVRRHLEEGEHFECIAADHGVTRERVRQIVRAAGVTVEDSREALIKGRIGRKKATGAGYVLVFRPGHPRADDKGYVLEHIVVAEGAIGRALRGGEVVHHANGQKDDNRPENLQVLSRAEHARVHNLRWTTDALLDAMRWLALMLGRTPRNSDINEAAGGISHMHFVHHFGSIRTAQQEAGLRPNKPLVSAPALTPMFRKQHGHLARFDTLDDLLATLHNGLPTEHERANVEERETTKRRAVS